MTSYSTNVINISLLKQYQNTFSQDKDKFNNDAYATFRSSYLNTCSDGYVSRMSSQLNSLYSVIQNSYTSINNWWSNYNSNAEGLENYLSTYYSSSLTESSLIGYVNSKLPKLKEKVFDVSTFSYFNNSNPLNNMPSNFSGFTTSTALNNIPSSFSYINSYNSLIGTPSTFSPLNSYNSLIGTPSTFSYFNSSSYSNLLSNSSKVVKVANSVNAGVVSGVVSGIKSISKNDVIIVKTTSKKEEESTWDKIVSASESVCADICCVGVSAFEGLMSFGESIGDTLSIAGTGILSVGTGIWDFGQWIGGHITGEEWESLTKKMWKGTMEHVSINYIKDEYDDFYENTEFGNWIKENAYGFDGVRAVTSGIGYVGGIIALSVATAGIGGVAVGGTAAAGGTATATTATTATLTTANAAPWIAAFGGFGKGTQDSWADGASLLEGLGYGTLNATLEGVSFWSGAKINQAKWFMPKNAMPTLTNKLLNSGSKVLADGGVGALEAFAQPVTLLYKDSYIDENGNEIKFTEDDNPIDRYVEIFDDNGGFKAVGTNVLLGLGLSSLGEIADVHSFVKINQTYKQLDAQIMQANSLTSGGSGATIKVNNIESIPSDLWNRIQNHDKINFEVDNKVLTFAEAEAIYNNKNYKVSDAVSDIVESTDDTSVDSNIESEVSTVMKDLDDEIAKANYYTGKGNFYTIDVDSLDDIPSDLWSKINDQSSVQFRVGDKIYSYADAKWRPEINTTIKNLDDQIAQANYYTGKGNFYTIDVDSLDDIPSDIWGKLDDSTNVQFRVGDKIYTSLEVKELANINKISQTVDGGKLTLSNLKYTDHGITSKVKSLIESNFKKFAYKDTSLFEGLNDKIAQNGLYHFTDAVDKILDSNYIKSSDIIASYGNRKSFFFAGIPEVGAFATNLDNIPLKTTAVKVDPSASVLDSSKLKVRYLDDGAITFDGRFDLTGSNATKEYFVLALENDELVYKSVSKLIYDSYENTNAGKMLAEFLQDKKNIDAIKTDYLFNLSAKNTNAVVGNVKSLVADIIVNKTDSKFAKTNELIEELESLAAAKSMTLKELGAQKSVNIISIDLQEKAGVLAKKLNDFAKSVEPKITSDMRLLEQDGVTKLVGLDHRLKGLDSLQRKIISDSSGGSKFSLEEAANNIGDSVRYTLLCDESQMVGSVKKSLDDLFAKGYSLLKYKNTFSNPVYKGINITMVSPDGVKFELQFHTDKSFYVKDKLNHLYYEIYRNEFTTEAEKKLAKQIMKLNTATIDMPKGVESLTLANILIDSKLVDANDIYNVAKDVAKNMPDFNAYRSHLQDHVIEVADYVDNIFKEYELTNGEVDTLTTIIAALYHDTGMNPLYRKYFDISDGILSVLDDAGNLTRKQHPLGSTMWILNNRKNLEKFGVNVDEAALLALSHSKSTSGILDMANPKEWFDSIQKIQSFINSDNVALSNLEFNVSKFGYFDDNNNFIFNDDVFERLQKEAAALRRSDAATTPTANTLSQNGGKFNYDEVDSILKIEKTDGTIVVSDELGTSYYLGEHNMKVTPKNGILEIEVLDPNLSPKYTFACIKERILEEQTMYNTVMKNDIVINLGQSATETTKNSYIDFVDNLKREFKLKNIGIFGYYDSLLPKIKFDFE